MEGGAGGASSAAGGGQGVPALPNITFSFDGEDSGNRTPTSEKRERRKSWRMDFTLTRPTTRKSGSAIDGFSTIRDAPPSPSKIPEHTMVLTNKVAEVKKAVKQKTALYVQDSYDQNMLHVAAYEGHLEMVTFLLTKYKIEDLSLRDKNGWTPLHCAARQRHYDICELLLKKGASPNSQNGTLTSPFTYAIRNELTPRLEEILGLMLKRGADIEMRNKWGETPLHNTCKRGNLETTVYLLNNGADINAIDNFGETALHKAAGFGSVPLVQALIEKGANPFVSGYCGTPLTVAMANRHQPVIEALEAVIKNRGGDNSNHAIQTEKAYDGPSIDNVDVAALLNIHGDEADASGPMKLDKPEEGDIVMNNDDFYFEIGKNEFFKRTETRERELVDLRIEDDKYVFDYGDTSQVDKNVLNIVGLARTGIQDEPLVISVVTTVERAKFRGIIRTKTGDHRFHIPAALVKKKKLKSKKVIKLLKASMPVLKLWHVTDPKLSKELLHHEDLKKREVRCYKIGVLYAKEGQKSEEEILGNQESSEAFDRFLELLGDKVTLEGWKGYRGDLDVNQNKNGEYSVYTKLHNEIEVMFHVSTYLPYDAYDPQQIPRKKYIGNDLVTIVFLEGDSFHPPCVSGDFLHVFGVVQPCKTEDGEDGYKLAVCSRKGVPQFGPPIPNPPTFKHNEYFRDFLLTKLMNGERAALHSPFIATKMKKSRQMQLEYIIKEFLPNAGE